MNIRKIHINNEIWKYSISNKKITIFSPNGYKLVTKKFDFHKFFNPKLSFNDYQEWWFVPDIKPSMIKQFILNKIETKEIF